MLLFGSRASRHTSNGKSTEMLITTLREVPATCYLQIG